MKSKSALTLAGLAVFVTVLLCFGCGPGFDGYEEQYSEVVPVSTEPWEGAETVFVVLEGAEVEVELLGMQTYDFSGAPAVSLSELIIASGLAADPEIYRYNFTATDGYDLLIKRYEDLSLLPSWEEMKNGFLYFDSRYDDLTCGWEEHPWGSALSAYHVKWMNGGRITLLTQ
jgi:hypothetical protein